MGIDQNINLLRAWINLRQDEHLVYWEWPSKVNLLTLLNLKIVAMDNDLASGNPLPPKIIEVEPFDNWKLELTFEGGEQRLMDMKPYRYGVFERLEEPIYFRRIRLVDGSLWWPHNQVLHYGMLYENSNPVGR